MSIKHHIVTGLALTLFCESCQSAPSKINAVPFATLALYDAGALWGGRELFILTNGVCVTRVIRPPKAGESGMQERRCQLQLERTDLDTLRQLLDTHHSLVQGINAEVEMTTMPSRCIQRRLTLTGPDTLGPGCPSDAVRWDHAQAQI